VDLPAGRPHIGRSGLVIGTRELVVSETPCVIPYRVEEDRLELIAVFHSTQKQPDITTLGEEEPYTSLAGIAQPFSEMAQLTCSN
jgi:hypothetical protein